MIYVFRINMVNPNTLETEVLRVTSGRHYLHAGEAYIPCVKDGTSISTSLFSSGTTGGDVTVGTGELVMVNTGDGQGSLDGYVRYGFDGQSFERWTIDDESVEIDLSAPDFRGVILNATFEWDRVRMTVKEKLEDLNHSIQTATFAGNNAGPVGVEGGEDLAGALKPMLYGECQNVMMIPVNASLLIFACNYDSDGNPKAVQQFVNVYDKGGKILYQEDVATLAALQAIEPDDGYYVSCRALGMFRLGTVPKGTVTADVSESSELDSSAARLTARVLDDAGYTNYSHANLEALHDLNACACQLYITDDTSVLTCVVMLLDSIGGWLVPDEFGFLSFGRFDLPENTDSESKLLITDDLFEAGSVKKQPTGDEGLGIPCRRVDLLYHRLHKTLTKDEVLESLSVEIREYFAREWRSATNAEIRLQPVVNELHPLAPTLTYETQLVGPRYLGLYNDRFSDPTDTEVTPGWDAHSTVIAGDGIVTIPDGRYIRKDFGLEGTHDNVEVYDGHYVLEIDLISCPSPLDLQVSVSDMTNAETLHGPLGLTEGFNSIPFYVPPDNTLHMLQVDVNCSAAGGATVLRSVRIRKATYGLTAEQEAVRRFGIHGSDLQRYTMDLHQTVSGSVRCGDKVTFQVDRFGLQDGVDFIVIGRDEDDGIEMTTLDILG